MNRRQKLIIVEAAAGFAAIMLYIWRLRFSAPRAWVFILGFFVLSHILRGERTAGLGLRWSNFRECVETMAPALLLLALALMAGGMLLQTIRPISVDYGFMCLLAYCPWGIFQQYLLNGYIANRLLAVWSARRVPLIAAALFAGAHLPNWFLMAVTFVMGYYSTKIFMRYRNIYFLGLAHAVIGTALFVVIPDSISHHLTVGPRLLSALVGQRDALQPRNSKARERPHNGLTDARNAAAEALLGENYEKNRKCDSSPALCRFPLGPSGTADHYD